VRKQAERRRGGWALGGLGAALLAAAAAGAQPVIVEPGWLLQRTDFLDPPQAARLNPKDGRLYVARISEAALGGGVYRIEADGSATLVAGSERPRGVVIDPDDGDVFHTEAGFPGEIYRTGFGETGRTTWVSGFHSGDDDPIGMCIAPAGYTGLHVAPGEALVADEGNNGPREIWRWSPDVVQLQSVVHAEDGTLQKPVDVAIGLGEIYVADQTTGVWRVEADTSTSLLAPLAGVRAVAVDPLSQDVLALDQVNEVLVRIDPATGTPTTVLSGLSLIVGSEASGLEATPDGAWLVVTDRGASSIYTYSRLAATGAPLSCGASLAGDFAALAESHVLAFDARAGDVVGVASAPIGGASVLPRAALFAPDGSRVGLGGEWVGCPGACASQPLPADGTYRLLVFEEDHDATGPFGLTLEALSGSLAGSSNAGPTPRCDATDGTQPLACGAVLQGSLQIEGDTDTFTFLGEAGDVFRVTTAPGGGSPVVPFASLRAPDGAPVDLNGAPGPCAGACDSAALPATGTYTVLVHDALLVATGAYTIALQELPLCQSACSDGLDNDGDLATDFPADAGCISADDFSELGICADGVDNDGDGLVDYPADPGCAEPAWPFEDPACDDGRDNDGDGLVDWDGGVTGGPSDPQCQSQPWRNKETANKRCGLGFELALLLPPLLALRARRRPRR
jgi:DNA-binding beta-propeller fold protein YncE